jgi:hypothetical protein
MGIKGIHFIFILSLFLWKRIYFVMTSTDFSCQVSDSPDMNVSVHGSQRQMCGEIPICGFSVGQ